jgi:hypothetical protein
LYLEALPLFTRGAISIPKYPPLTREVACWSAKPTAAGATPWTTLAAAATTSPTHCAAARR